MPTPPTIGNYPVSLPHEEAQKPEPVDQLKVGKPGFATVAKAAFDQEWTFTPGEGASNKFDEGFHLTPDLLKRLTDGLPEEFHSTFEHAISEDNAWAMRAKMQNYLKNEETLHAAGWEGPLLRIGAAIADPVNLALGFETGGAVAALNSARKVGRLVKIAEAGLAGAVAGAVPTSVKQVEEPWRNPADIAYAAAFTGLLSSGVGAIAESLPSLRKPAYDLMKRFERNAVEDAGMGFSQKGLGHYFPDSTHLQYAEGALRSMDGAAAPKAEVAAVRSYYADSLTPREAAARMEQLALKTGMKTGEESFFFDAFSNTSEVQRALELIGKPASQLTRDELTVLEKFRAGEFTRTKFPELFDQANLGRSIPTEGEVYDAVRRDANGPGSVITQQRPPANSAGAAANATTAPLSNSAQQALYAANPPKTALGRLRYDMVGRLKSSDHPLVRELASKLGMDAVGNADHSVNIIAASEIQRGYERTWQTAMRKSVEPAYDSWIKELGISPYSPKYFRRKFDIDRRDSFFSQVTREVRNPGSSSSPAIQKAASGLRDLYAEIGSLAQNPKAKVGGSAPSVRGFEQFQPNDLYVTRRRHDARLHELLSDFGGTQVVKLVRGSLERTNPNWTPEILDKVSEGYVKAMRRLGAGMEMDFQRAISQADTNLLRQMLDTSGLAKPEIEQFMHALEQANPEQGIITRGKHRVRLDENFEDYLVNQRTGRPEKVSIGDMFDDNAERLSMRYIRQMSGAVALAEHGIVDKASFADAINKIRSAGPEIGGKYSGEKMEKEIAMLETLYKSVSGIPLEDYSSSSARQVGQIFRNYNFGRVMGQLALAQIPDAGLVIAESGWKTLLKQVPTLRHILRDAKTGTLNSAFLDELESVWGFGTDPLRNQLGSGGGDFGFNGEHTWRSWLERPAELSEAGRKFITSYSGFAQTNAFLQRAAGASAVQHFTDVAFALKPEKSVERLAMLGLDPATAQRIYGQIRQFATVEDGLIFQKQIRRINLDRWTDADAASSFVNSINRWAGKTIQESDIGTLPQFMTKELFKTLFQFRSFMGTAWANQTLSAVHMHDLTAANMILLSTMIAGLTYVGQTHLNAVGRDDRDLYLEKRLDPLEIAKQSFAKAGYSSIVPFLIDSGSDFTAHKWYKPQFSFSRGSGLGTGMLAGSPAVDVADKVSTAIGATGRLVFDPSYYMNKEDAGAFTSLLPFQRLAGVTNLLRSMANDLPTHAPRNN